MKKKLGRRKNKKLKTEVWGELRSGAGEVE